MVDKIDRDLSILHNNLIIAKKELGKFDEGKSRFSSREKIEEMINNLERKINEVEVKNDIEIIIPYLKSIKVDLDFEKNDGIYCKLARFDNKRYLEYMIENNNLSYNTKKRGVVIYSIYGTVLFNFTFRYPNNSFFPIEFKEGKHIYEEIAPEKVLIDKDNFVLDISTDPRFHRQIHFKTKSRGFKEVHQFMESDLNIQEGRHSFEEAYYFRMLKTNSDEKIGSYGGRLYSILEGRYLNRLSFDKIYDQDLEVFSPYFGIKRSDIRNEFIRIMKDHNLLLGVNCLNQDNLSVNTFCYLDINGNIVSKLFYFPCNNEDFSLSKEYDIRYIDVTNDTYEESLKQVIELSLKEKQLNHHDELHDNSKYKKRLRLISDSYNIGKEK